MEARLLPNVSIRVLPLAAGPHRASVTGEFTILDFPDEGAYPEPTTVYLESHTGALYLDRPREAEACDRIWSSLVAKALGGEESSERITAIMKELNGCA